MDRSKSARYYKLAADQGSVEAQLRYANCLLAGDGVETNKREAERYFRLASSQGDVKAHMRYGIVLLSGQLGRFNINRARIEFHLAAPENHFGSMLSDALSQPLHKLELMEDFGELRSVFTFLRRHGSPSFSDMRTLNFELSRIAIVESDVMNTWRAMASDTIGYLSDFNDIWAKVRSMSEPLLQSRLISEMIEIIFRMYSAECSLYENVNFFLRHIPVQIVAKFITEFRGILCYIYLLQASINHLTRQNPFEEEIVVYRTIKGIDPELKPLYQSAVGEVILWRAFTSTSRDKAKAIWRLRNTTGGILFEIRLPPNSVAADIHHWSEFENELEVLIAAYTAFRIDEIVDFRIQDEFPAFEPDIVIPTVKMSHTISWFDFALEC
jgi:hypothetical protein